MKIVLTGYSGFIGNCFLNFLSKNKLNSIYLLGRKKINKYNYEYWDLANRNISSEFIKNTDVLIHFASIAHTNYKKKHDFKRNIFTQNYDSTIYLANLSISLNLKKFVFISSTKSLDNEFKKLSISQLKKLNTNNFYGKIKRITEMELQKIFLKTKTKLLIIRPSLVYGPQAKGNLLFLKNYISKSPLVILPYINNKRSLIHIDNLIKSIDFVVFKNKLDINNYTFADDNDYSFHEICVSINRFYKKKILFIKIPTFILKYISLFAKFFRINHIDKIYTNEIYEKTDIKKYGYKDCKKIKDYNESSF